MKFPRFAFFALLPLVAWCVIVTGSYAQDTAGEAVLLEEADPPPPPTLVNARENAVEKYESGEMRFDRQIARYSDDSFVNNGTYKEFYLSGQVFVEGEYDFGVRSGEWTYYHENGKVAKKVKFDGGKPEGAVEVRREDGTLATRREFKLGKRHGKWTKYDATGEEVRREQEYADGKPVGTWREWFDDGTLWRETPFRDGKRDGKASQWNEDGSPRATVEFTAGLRDGLTVEWDATGKKTERVFKEGKLQAPGK